MRLGYSTCPNDTFIFGALALHRVPDPFGLSHVLADVETLNQWAVKGRLEVTKLSFFALGKVLSRYALLHTGAALGRGCGPLVVCRPGTPWADLDQGVVAAPGELTTARLLLTLYLGAEPRFRQMPFHEVMPAVAAGKADFGLIIHEGRFTYPSLDLRAVLDLGQWWEEETGLPIPLGGIAIRRDQGPKQAALMDQIIRASLSRAKEGDTQVMDYVRCHAQEMAPEVIREHIALYVNASTEALGAEEMEAVGELLARAASLGLIPPPTTSLLAY